jgi:outer membrane protein assembly factor BamE (lipoprotein component of BamABCDE complex)
MKRLSCLLLIFLFIGCATIGNKNILDQDKVSQIKRGETTKTQVREIIGDPSKTTFGENDEETWEYVLSKSQTRAATFIPIVGLFAGGADMQHHTLTIKFNKQGIVKEYGQGKTVGGGGSLLD